MYIIVYNTSTERQRIRLEEGLLRRLKLGASIKEGVYLIPENEGVDMRSIRVIIDELIINGDSVYIQKLGRERAYRGYPLRFRKWLEDKE